MLTALNEEHCVNLYSGAEVRALDRIAIDAFGIPGIVLMKRAARAVFARIIAKGARSIAVLCGSGNNAGDGYVIAGLARLQGMDVQLLQVGDAAILRGDAATARDWAVSSGVHIEQFAVDMALDGEVIVDALLGTGLQGPARPAFAAAIAAINAHAANGKAWVIAVDLPSGLDADTGDDFGCAVDADETVTFIGAKRGSLTGVGPQRCGAIWFDDLDVPASTYAKIPYPVVALRWGASGARPMGPRPRHAHKGTSGHVLVVGGASGYGGAALLAAEGALRAGAGLVSLACALEHAAAVLARRPEVMVRGIEDVAEQFAPLLARATVIVVGPGLGQDAWSQAMLAAAINSKLPLVIDADALNLLAASSQPWPQDALLTPHPGEAARILNCTTREVQQDRFAAVRALAARTCGVVVLKGAGSLIDDGHHTWLCMDGNPGMAVGGMGDVLAGMLGALRAQGLSAVEAACHGVCLHARAGDLMAARSGERGLLPSDLLEVVPGLLNGRI